MPDDVLVAVPVDVGLLVPVAVALAVPVEVALAVGLLVPVEVIEPLLVPVEVDDPVADALADAEAEALWVCEAVSDPEIDHVADELGELVEVELLVLVALPDELGEAVVVPDAVADLVDVAEALDEEVAVGDAVPVEVAVDDALAVAVDVLVDRDAATLPSRISQRYVVLATVVTETRDRMSSTSLNVAAVFSATLSPLAADTTRAPPPSVFSRNTKRIPGFVGLARVRVSPLAPTTISQICRSAATWMVPPLPGSAIIFGPMYKR